MQPNIRLIRLPLGTRYAIQGMVLLAASAKVGDHRQVSDLASEGKLPRNYLSKIFQVLTRAGLLDSKRGRGGGYALTRPAAQIRLSDIVDGVADHFPEESHCLLRPEACTTETPCVLHSAVIAWEELIRRRLEDTTLEEAVGEWKPG